VNNMHCMVVYGSNDSDPRKWKDTRYSCGNVKCKHLIHVISYSTNKDLVQLGKRYSHDLKPKDSKSL